MGIAARLVVTLVVATATNMMFAMPAQSAQHSAQVFHERLRGLTAVAVDEIRLNRCRFKSVVVSGQTNGQRREALYEEVVTDICTDDERQVSGSANATSFKVEAVGQLRRAHLVADVPLDDGRLVHVDETFTGVGEISRDARVDVVHADGFHFLSTRLERFRQAYATGTVTSRQAYLLYARDGTLNVCTPRATSDNCAL